jgi:chromosomal replication initiation ATPase DnaA
MKQKELNQISRIKTFIEQEMNLVDMFKKTRRREYVDSRRIFFCILRNKFLLTYHAIGEISERDHATIIYAIKTFENIIKIDRSLNSIYQKTLEEVEFITSVPKLTRKEEILNKIKKLNQELLSLVD